MKNIKPKEEKYIKFWRKIKKIRKNVSRKKRKAERKKILKYYWNWKKQVNKDQNEDSEDKKNFICEIKIVGY